ncbi:hypothetical protein LI142_10875 [Eubacterium limosum]|uniref:hypothetical protein n=1 Tax=Eubacterium limosum TaxID=1736 RepID=UPI001D05F3F8|nr:hypothetical protein [Eubacterium limosum]MCB6570002.1 hypothetical protein [Eubacterium limosum]
MEKANVKKEEKRNLVELVLIGVLIGFDILILMLGKSLPTISVIVLLTLLGAVELKSYHTNQKLLDYKQEKNSKQ